MSLLQNEECVPVSHILFTSPDSALHQIVDFCVLWLLHLCLWLIELTAAS